MLSILDMTRVKRLLCLGAHCDDIEIGAGGTVMRLAKAYPQIEVRSRSSSWRGSERVEEARRSAEVFLAGAGASEIFDLWVPRWLSAVPRRAGQGSLRGSQVNFLARPNPDPPRR